MKKMIVLDLDGTLLNAFQKVSKKSIDYLQNLKEQGYIITIATGRILASVLNVTNNSSFANYIISDTGATCFDKQNNKFLSENFLSQEIIEEVLSYYNEKYKFIDVCSSYKIYKYSNSVIENNSCVETTFDKNVILKECKEIAHISIVMENNQYVLELYHQLLKNCPNLEIIIMQDSFGEKKWIEILPKGCSKYNAIKKLANTLNIQNEDIIAFGDGLNDIEMLEKCGVGVAMQNALDEVKKASDYITKYPNTEDGVIHFLEDYLDN